jgi:hypothetical protein
LRAIILESRPRDRTFSPGRVFRFEFTSAAFLHEVKHDWYRIMVIRDGGRVHRRLANMRRVESWTSSGH